jgi:hypothetical protein
MANHFHLYIQTRQANLSRFMHSLLTSFTLALNRRHRSCGHLFQSRFAAHLVESRTYGGEVSRYIHLNPVCTRVMKRASVSDRRRALRAYPWSSYGACLGLATTPEWFDPTPLLGDWGASRHVQQRRYGEYVEEGLLRDLDSPLARLDGQAILGTEDFCDRIRRAYVLTRTVDKREQPAVERARRSVPFDEVARCVARQYGVRPDSLMTLRGSDRQARRLLMYGVCCYSRAGESLTALAQRFGISLSGLTMACSRIEQQLRRDRTLQETWLRIEQQLKML